MDHIVYINTQENELQMLLDEKKRMLIRATNGRRTAGGQVNPGDHLYFAEDEGEGWVRARAQVSFMLSVQKLTEEEARQLVEANQGELQLSPAQFARCARMRNIVLVCVADIQSMQPFLINRAAFPAPDDWLSVEDIERVRLSLPALAGSR